MTIIEDGLLAEIQNFLHDFVAESVADGPFEIEAQELLDKLKGR